MKREIKFRAWDTEDHRMLSDFADDMMIQMNTGQLGWYDEDNFVACNYPLMQYIGLKDSKGVEIYEGDIIELDSQSKRVGVVEWFGASFNCQGEDLYIDDGAYKIIGNIYENPELL